MKKAILSSVFLMIFLASCSEDEIKKTEETSETVTNLKSIHEDGILKFEYFYNDGNLLDHYRIYNGQDFYEITFTYNTAGKVEKLVKKLNGTMLNATHFYTYNNDGTIAKIDQYGANDVLYNTATFTYDNGKVTLIDNSDKSVQGLKFTAYEYDANGNVSKISADFYNPRFYTYITDKTVPSPLAVDGSNPLNQVENPIATFTFVQYSSYTSVYEYNEDGNPVKETRTFPGQGDLQTVVTFEYE